MTLLSPLSDAGRVDSRPSHVREMDTLLSTLSRFFRAERSGLFLFNDVKGKRFELKAARNLSHTIVQADTFRDNLAVIFKSFHDKKPVVIQPDTSGANVKKRRSVLCLPLLINRRWWAFFILTTRIWTTVLILLKRHTESTGALFDQYHRKIYRFGQADVKQEPDMGLKPSPPSQPVNRNSSQKTPQMTRILNQAQRQARSDAAILIHGDTGVGKEVLPDGFTRTVIGVKAFCGG